MNIRKKAAASLAALLAGTMAFCSCSAPDVASEKPIVEKEGAFVTIDINPSIELVLDENQTVISVGAANSDAEVMLWQEEGLVGAKVDAAVARISELAVEMGYLTEENRTVSVTVTTDRGKTEDALLAAIDETIEETVREAGIEVRVEEAVDLVLTKELARVKEQNAGKTGYDDTLTLSRYRLVCSALRADRELTMDEAVRMTNEALTDVVNAAQRDATAKLGEACELARSEAAFIYDNAKQTLLDSAYTAVYAERMNLTSLFANYGASYAAYRLAYRTVEHYSESLRQLIENPIFTSDDVFALANALGIDTSAEEEYDAFRAAITDENGKITKDSVNAYLNAQYKNLDEEERAKLEEAYDGVLDILDRLGAEASVVTDDGTTTITAALLGLDVSVSVKTYEDIPALLDAIEQKINATYARMQEDLTENEKAKVQDKQDAMSEKLASLEKTYNETVVAAKAEAEARLSAAKAARGK